MRQPGVRGEWAWAPCKRVVAGTRFDNMRRISPARRRGGQPTIRGLGRQVRRQRSVALREAVRVGVGDAGAVADTLLGVATRLSEAHSGRAWFEGWDQASLSSLANPKTEVARGQCRARRDGG